MNPGFINIDGLVSHRLQFNTLEDSFTNLYSSEKRVIKAESGLE